MTRTFEWTEQLGEAYLADPAAVMDAVQRLRCRAQSAGRLVTTPQEFGDRREPMGEVRSAAAPDLHLLALLAGENAEAVVLDLVQRRQFVLAGVEL